MFRTKLISLLFTINVSIGVANGEQSVRLDAYSGVGSVLLVWSKTDDISAKGIHIYRSIDRRKSYQRLSEIDPGRTRYLDVNLIEGQTAFYHIEFVLDTGKSIKSDLGMEPFAQSLSFQKVGNYENLSKPVSGELNDVSLISNQIMIEFFKNEFPTENTSEFSVISSKLSGTEKLNQWFGLVRTKLLPNMETLGSEEKINALNNLWNKRWEEYEPIFRNALLMTPVEYKKTGEKELQDMVELVIPNAMLLLDRDLELIESSSRIIVVKHGRQDIHADIELYTLVDIPTSTLVFKNELEDIKIELQNVAEDSSLNFSLPENWNQIEVILDQQSIAHFPIIKNEGTITHYLNGHYGQTDYVNQLIYPQTVIHSNDYWLNEILYDPNSNSLKVEIAGKSDQLRIYGVFIDDELLWTLREDLHLEQTYLDSIFTIESNYGSGGWLHLKLQDEYGNWQTYGESRPIFFNKPLMECRIPDGGNWQDVNFSTFGEPNDFRKPSLGQQIIPEVFAMFQNYPNPFNANTSVSIDLIEHAVIDLFVTDAGGRKIQEFVQSEALSPGQYSFVWDAHDHSSGVYFLTIIAKMKDFHPVVQSRKMIYLK